MSPSQSRSGGVWTATHPFPAKLVPDFPGYLHTLPDAFDLHYRSEPKPYLTSLGRRPRLQRILTGSLMSFWQKTWKKVVNSSCSRSD